MRLSEDTLKQTWKDYKRTKSAELKDVLVREYGSLVSHAAKKVGASLPDHVDRDDLESAGMIGLVESIERFNVSAGNKFETFSAARIRGAIMDELRSQDWLSRMLRIRIHKIERTARKLEMNLGREATNTELAKATGLPHDKVKQAMTYKRATFFSLDRYRSNETGSGVNEMKCIQDSRQDDPAEQVLKGELRELIADRLSETERLVITLYYYEQLTMKEVGEVLEMSESRVCQIHTKIINDLKKHIG